MRRLMRNLQGLPPRHPMQTGKMGNFSTPRLHPLTRGFMNTMQEYYDAEIERIAEEIESQPGYV